jgi:hypothetical protein
LSCLGCPGRLSIFFLTVHYFNSFDPIVQQAGQWAGSRAGSPIS